MVTGTSSSFTFLRLSRRFPKVAGLLLLLLFSFHPTAAAEVSEDDSAAIRTLTTEMWRALGKQNLEEFRSFCSDNWKLLTAAGNRFSAERLFEVHQENIRGFNLESSGMKVHVEGDFAWATFDAVMSGDRQGEPWGGEFLMTQIFERQDDGWQCVHTHESRKPAAE